MTHAFSSDTVTILYFSLIINKPTKTSAVLQLNLTNLSFPLCKLQKVPCLKLECVEFDWYSLTLRPTLLNEISSIFLPYKDAV